MSVGHFCQAKIDGGVGKRNGTALVLVSRQICKVGISLADVEEGSVEKPNWDGDRIKIFLIGFGFRWLVFH